MVPMNAAMNSFGTAHWVGSLQTDLMLGPGEMVRCNGDIDDNTTGFNLDCSFFGRLIDN